MGLTVSTSMVKTFVTKGSSGKSIAVGVYKYTPGPPTPGFVPAPGVNIADSGKLKNGSDTVFFDGESVMLKSSTVGSSGDEAPQMKGLISSQTTGDAKAVVVPGTVKIGDEDVVTFGTASLNDDAPAGSAKSGAAKPVTLKAGDPLKAKEIALKEAPKVDIDGVEGQNNTEEAKEAEEKSIDNLDFKASVGGGLLSVPDFEERAKERQKRIDFAKEYEAKHRPAWMKRHLNPELLQGRFTELLQNQHYAIEQYLHVLGEIVPFINKRLEEAQAKRGAENAAKGLPAPAAIRVTQTELLATFLVEGGINCMDSMRMDHLDGYGDLGTDHFIDLARDNKKRGGKGGFTAAELALKVEQRYRDFLHPDLIAIIEDPDISPPKWRWGSDERQKQYITVTEIDLREGAYLSAAMFAGCKTAIAEAMLQPGLIRGPSGELLDPTKFPKPYKAVYQGPQGTAINGAAPSGGNVVGEFKQPVDLSTMSLPDQFFWATVSFNCGQPYGDRSDPMWNARSNNWLETAKSCEEHDVRYDGRDFSAGEGANSNGLRNALLREGIRQAQEQLLTPEGKSGNKPLFRKYVGKQLSLEEALEKEPEYRKQFFEPFFEGKERVDITEPIPVLYVDRRLSDYQEYIAAIIAHPDCPDEAKAELEAIDAKIFTLSDLPQLVSGLFNENIKLADGMFAQYKKMGRARGDYFFNGSFKTESGAWLDTTEYLRARKNICQDWANEPLRSNGLRAAYELNDPYFIKMYREAKFRQLDVIAKLPNFKKPSAAS